jgi:hypothetical protein
MGLLIPFGVIYTDDLLDTKIKSRLTWRKTTIPFIGDLPTSDTPSEIMKPEKQTSSAEAWNHKNQSGVYVKSEGMAKTIFLTSTFPKREDLCFRKSCCHICLSGKKYY